MRKFVEHNLLTKTLYDMKKILVTLVALLTIIGARAQKIYSTNFKSQADFTVYVVDAEYKADLIVYKTDKEYRAKSADNKGIWYFTDSKLRADKVIYFVDYQSQADLKVYFTDKEYRAGWKDKQKQPLLY